MDLLTNPSVLALLLLVGVLCWAFAHFGVAKKLETAFAAGKAEASKVATSVEAYSDDELVKLTGAFISRLADTSGEVQKKADADAAIARKTALLARVQSVVAAAKTGA